jgi:beta-lactamase superfamily II metal-dependent hydrolase
MEINIFDVSHGFCAYLIADNGNVMLFDCGHNDQTGFRPSSYLTAHGCSGIEHLIIQNFDQDHISDLSNVLSALPVTLFFRNRTITPSQLQTLKLQSGPLTDAMTAAIRLHERYIHPVPVPPPFPDIDFATFYNPYPLFTDTNNLSLVSFVVYDGVGIVFTGDLETAGWTELLKNPTFRNYLARTRIFIASHHGRTSGYCPEVFNFCKPEIIIISDKEIVHQTQEQDYSPHASGVLWNCGPGKRYVLTTRLDGKITITKSRGEGFRVTI